MTDRQSPPEPFGDPAPPRTAERGQFCAGIDPHAALLAQWGLPDDVGGLERFALGAVEAVAPVVPVVKPQSAFYERFGSRGIAVLERVVARAREAGALVLLDVKRGDIGSTSQAYADAYLDPASPLAADAITASPFLGFGSLDPFFDTARRHGAGRLRARAHLQQGGPRGAARRRSRRAVRSPAPCSTGCASLNDGAEPLGSFGAVVGATIGETEEDLDVNGPLLAPGYGAQGGTAADLRRIFGAAARAVLPSTSREVLRARPGPAAPWPTPAAGPTTSSRRRRMRRLLVAVLAGPLLLAGCGEPSAEEVRTDYCEAVKEHQRALSDRLADRLPDGPARGAADLPRPRSRGARATSPTSGTCCSTRIEGLDQALATRASTPRRTTRSSRRPTSPTSSAPRSSAAAAELLNPPDRGRRRGRGAAGARRVPDPAEPVRTADRSPPIAARGAEMTRSAHLPADPCRRNT